MNAVTAHTAELAFEADAFVGESPFWDAGAGVLHWVDVERGMLHVTDLDDGHDRAIVVADRLGSVVPRADEPGWIAGVRDGVALLDADGRVVARVDVEADRPTQRMNDAACDAAGRFWTGTMDEAHEPGRAALYCIDHHLDARTARTEVSLSNGIAWSPDGATMYHVDSTAATVTAFDFDVDAGSIAAGRLVDIDHSATPDGMAVDVDGGLWIAYWEGSCVRRFTPGGALDAVVDLPVPLVTSVAFAGTTLFITSGRSGLDDRTLAGAPLSGSVFAADVGVEGVPVHRFRSTR